MVLSHDLNYCATAVRRPFCSHFIDDLFQFFSNLFEIVLCWLGTSLFESNNPSVRLSFRATIEMISRECVFILFQLRPWMQRNRRNVAKMQRLFGEGEVKRQTRRRFDRRHPSQQQLQKGQSGQSPTLQRKRQK